ncbi:MAG: AlpA family transcriptional regulator [Rhodocyclaceae bacterium]|nr:AlpA family transcriptional regulator [Rhodocyclaceae bacterium]MCP5308502.1 AlpA family transcriptional regulator [Zoogloeaceae bacterium]
MAAHLQTEPTKYTVIRRREVEARTGLSRSTIYERIRAGTFPAPVSLGARAVGWVESEISDWLVDQIAKSRNAA